MICYKNFDASQCNVVYSADLSEYYIADVSTGEDLFAGTDSRVLLTLLGENGTSSALPLNNPTGNGFERGQTVTLALTTEYLGKISSIL